MQEELRRIHREIGGTFIFVTHDQSEAFALANRVVVMNEGRIEQIGAPEDDLSATRDRCSSPISSARPPSSPASGANGAVHAQRRRGFRRRPAPDGPVRVVVRPERVAGAAGDGHGRRPAVTDVGLPRQRR